MDDITKLNDYFDCIYVINLKKRPDRLLKLLAKLHYLDIKIEVIEAVDGSMSPHINNYKKYVHDSEFIFKNISAKKRIPNYGAWGYLLSWKKILNGAIKNGYKNFLSFDDDVMFQRDFQKKFSNFVKYLPDRYSDSWKIINLGASQHNIIDLPTALPYYYPDQTDGSFATGVHHSVFKELLDLISPMDYAFDSGALRAIYKKYPEQCFVAYPNLIIADVTDSSIRNSRNQENMARKVGWRLDLFPDYSHGIKFPLITVIICAYNAADTIEMSVQSIQVQSYKNLEIIVVDDCSTDSTVKIVTRLIDVDSRITFIQNPENLGCYGSRNVALKQCKGEFITFHDADDYSLSNRIEQQFIYLVQHNVIFTTCLIMRSHLPNFEFLREIESPDNKNKGLIQRVRKLRTHIKKDGSGNYEYCCKAILGMVTTLFRREVFEKLGLYWELRCIADAEYCERVLFHYTNPRKSFIKDESVVSYLSNVGHIPGIYYMIKNVLYISKEMNAENITNKYKGRAKYLETLRDNWRAKLKNKFNYEYPKL